MTRFIAEVLIATAAVLVIGFMAVRLIGRAKRKPGGGSTVGWALLFLGFGQMPPPPPASQIELEMNSKKDRLVSRDLDE